MNISRVHRSFFPVISAIPVRGFVLWLLLLIALVPLPIQAEGIWIDTYQLQKLPVTGEAWANVKRNADKSNLTFDLADKDNRANIQVLAKALVFRRLHREEYRQQVLQACAAIIGTELNADTLALGRELAAYVIAADLVKLDPEFDILFRSWLKELLSLSLEGRSLRSTHEDRPNNWGTHAGASRAAIAVYLDDRAELDRTAMVFKGWLGDHLSYAGFRYGDKSWQADPAMPVGVNPRYAKKDGHNIDGVLPDDQRRGGGFSWPPPKENYVWEALQGALVQAVILNRAGFDVWNWQNKALLRAYSWLHYEANYPAQGDDTWQLHLVNYFYNSEFPAPVPAGAGKNMGWADWTHGPDAPPKTSKVTIIGLIFPLLFLGSNLLVKRYN